MGEERASPRWVPINSYSMEYEAEIARAVLEAGGFDAIVQGGPVGIFGPGFQGATSHGVTVLVPRQQLEAARTYLALREVEE